ncbi:NUDIX domain-containing protein [Streptomyces stramineus]
MTDTELEAEAIKSGTGVSALITNSQGDYLLHLRDDIEGICWPGYWTPVGGRPEPGESPDTVAREVAEETGLIIPLEEFTTVQQRNAEHLGKGPIAVYTGHWDGDAHALPSPRASCSTGSRSRCSHDSAYPRGAERRSPSTRMRGRASPFRRRTPAPDHQPLRPLQPDHRGRLRVLSGAASA